MGVHVGWSKLSVRPSFKWFPFYFHDVFKETFSGKVDDIGNMKMNKQVMKRFVSFKTAKAFLSLLDD